MPDTFTANYNLTKPEPNASRDTWGTKWNANLDELDTIVKGISDNRLPYNPTTKSTASEIDFTGPRPKAVGVELATKNDIYAHLPAGSVIMWWGPLNAIPAGWALCNGANGTPNLTDRVPVAASANTPVGSIGGSITRTLTEANMPPHAHLVNLATSAAGAHFHTGNTDTAGNHNHSYTRYSAGNASVAFGSSYSGVLYGSTSVNTASDGSHSHGITTAWVGDHQHIINGMTDQRGSAAAIDIRQPYMGIVFIMKLAAPAP